MYNHWQRCALQLFIKRDLHMYTHIYISMFIHIVLVSVPIGLTSPKLAPRAVGHPWEYFPI